jgi:glucose-1-phosphate cytidylyltransferase
MKVVLFCGGAGTRLREHSERVPKPLAPIGDQPLLWHLMRYYRHFGHDEFILCVGYGADLIKEFFLGHGGARCTDVEVADGGAAVEILEDTTSRKVVLVDTGVHASIGQRLRAVAELLDRDEMFLANYSDGLTDLPLAEYVDEFSMTDAVGSFLAVHPSQSFHSVAVDGCGIVTDFRPARESGLWINGGFFVFRNAIFDYLHDGEDLVEAPFQRLIGERRLRAHQFDGFWASMDTYKDKMMFDELNRQGRAPWMVWKA